MNMGSTTPPVPFSSWDDLRFFLTTAKAGSFSQAARELRVTQSTISRRIEGLEQQLGVRLFDRVPSGAMLTTDGDKVLEVTRQIEDSVLEIQRRVLGSDERLQGLVRISLPEGLSTLWITPHLPAFQERHPGISIALKCSTRPADVLNMESDLSLWILRPQTPDLIAVKLGAFHLVPWASRTYLERCGTPSTQEDLRHHRFLDHALYRLDEANCGHWVALMRGAKETAFWTNSSLSLISAAQNGLGIALLPTYLCTCVNGILPLDLAVRTQMPIWLTYHRDVRSAARVRIVIDWLKSLFDQKTRPWFREAYHPPESQAPDLHLISAG